MTTLRDWEALALIARTILQARRIQHPTLGAIARIVAECAPLLRIEDKEEEAIIEDDAIFELCHRYGIQRDR